MARHEMVSVTLHYILVNNPQNNEYLSIYLLSAVYYGAVASFSFFAILLLLSLFMLDVLYYSYQICMN